MRLAPSLHRVGNDIVAFYLVEDDRGITMVDAGISGQWADLEAQIGAMGRTLADIRAVILTHGDSDHIGVAERLRHDHDIPVFVHEADAALARGEVKSKNPGWGRFKIGPLLSFLWYAGRHGGLKTIPVEEVTTLAGGATLDLPGDPQIIHIPGHSPGSIAVHMPAVGALFVGDALTTRHVLTGEEGPQPAPFTIDPDGALQSLTRLEHLETDWVLPGHGPPWQGSISEVVERVRARAS